MPFDVVDILFGNIDDQYQSCIIHLFELRQILVSRYQNQKVECMILEVENLYKNKNMD
jgi:hypothetical protein